MLATATLEKKLTAINRVLEGAIPVDVMTRRELCGSKQALEWALGRSALCPVKAVWLNAQVVVDGR